MKYTLKKDEYIHGGTQKDYYSEEDVEACRCLLCDSKEFKTIYRERGYIGVVECFHCKLVYANPKPKNAEENYHGNVDVYFQEARLIFSGKKTHHRDKNYLYEINKIKKYKSKGKLLDIGCNMGFFLRKARQEGFEVTGVEPSPPLSKIAFEQFKLKVVNSYFVKGVFQEEQFDVITMIDVFEHVTNPRELLQVASETIKKDGILCIKVPNANYNILKFHIAKLLKKENEHDIFNAYEHVGHYSKATMKNMLLNNGFTIDKVIVPIPIHPPVWAQLTGHYFQYPSPKILDFKRILIRNLFYVIGYIENLLGLKVYFAPDLMFIIKKKN